MTETARIRWEDEPETGDAEGSVGTLEPVMFHIDVVNDADADLWVLTTQLPGMEREPYRLYRADRSELKRAAEDWLAGFVSSLGAVFPGGHPEGNAIEAYCATGAGDGDGMHLLQYAVRLPDGTTTAYGDQSWVSAGRGARDAADGASTVVRDIWVSYGPWRTHETTAATAGEETVR